MKKLQKQVDEWMSQLKIGYWKPFEMLARLMEEVGELAREVNHRFGPKKKKSSEKNKEIGDEMADIIFTLICLANSLNIDLDTHFKKMMKKLNTRDKDRWKKSKSSE
ncbi:nucleotide pyrophosphohydrolase [Candidatus Woesebacteria bacterium RBG_16_36_11]|uniref:Nucleotide pyrophosphohydrolase n=3 Tax=Candidatus Woeseibacteriota TaxID=1752722 RepID=A0A1F7XB97_9BACT|nr:MAG: nucleotide pyrophosphohydrolase [Candidatus Woesebacteria bacterium RBG_13_36_22]OGM12286.1 MAG: nucleotide pyrophosphohydrolase [Candidatus Woesebacteria bacterium RBG_16_36_11]OGM16685.1 MAG: nucleotide pyrophosphohydrolase [Candidatus Woesebacteria bacterium RBG_19FT_COMBO_37_29]